MVKQSLVCIFLFFSLLASAQTELSNSLEQKVSIQFSNTTLQASIRQLMRVSGVRIFYASSIIPRDIRINQTFNNRPLGEIISEILAPANLFYRELNGFVVVNKQVFSERKISGRVVDKNGSPLPFANVFIQNGTQGSATDVDGQFVIEDVPDIRFNLVVSYVSYKTKTIPFAAEQELDGRQFVIELELDPIALETIDVTSRAIKRRDKRNQRRLFNRFVREFLGGSENAEKCRIINPEVLRFEVLDSLDNYRVTAEDLLYVENYALGYKISYVLEEFRFENGLKMNLGRAKYAELETKSRKRYSKWEVEREKAYLGSPQHFLNALIEDKLLDEGFAVNVVNYDSVTSEYTTTLNPPPVDEILTLVPTNQEYLYLLRTNSDIEVTYRGEYEDSEYKKLYRSTSKSGNYKYTDKKVSTSIALSDNASLSSYQVFGLDLTDVDLFQKSILFFLKDEVQISYPGQFMNPRDVLIAGWWRWGAFSDWLPLNYRPN